MQDICQKEKVRGGGGDSEISKTFVAKFFDDPNFFFS
jgi:hypothetical protein